MSYANKVFTLEAKDMVLKDVKEASVCTICSFALQPPLCWCENGHANCWSCKRDLVQCPICRANFKETELNLVFINNILGCLPRECENRLYGCQVISQPTVLKEHEPKCVYREVDCRILLCGWKGVALKLVDHIENTHPDQQLLGDDTNVYWPVNLYNCNEYEAVNPFNGINYLYWMYTKIDKIRGKFYIFFVKVLIGYEPAGEIFSSVTLATQRSPVSFKYTHEVLDEDVNTEEVYSEENCIQFPLQELHHFFLVAERILSFQFKIFRV